MNNKLRRHIFTASTLLSYIGLLLIPNAKWSVFPFGLFFVGSYFFMHSVPKALFISSVFAIPFDFGKSLLKLDIDTSYLILSPLAFFSIVLTIFTLRNKTQVKIRAEDVLLCLFLLWGIFSFLHLNTYYPVVDGLFDLSIAILFYLLARIYSKDRKTVETMVFIFLSLVVFESVIAMVQFARSYPLGIFIEQSVWYYPYGRVDPERGILFRPAGTFVEPTWLSRFINVLLPFAGCKIASEISIGDTIRKLIFILGTTAVVISLTRVSIVLSFVVLAVIVYKKRPSLNYRELLIPANIFIFILSFAISFVTFPTIFERIKSTGKSFDVGGSIAFRVTLAREASNLIRLSPVFGVGLNQFETRAKEENVTGFFDHYVTKVHNVPLIIASEMGIPALLIFSLFVVFSYRRYFKSRHKKEKMRRYKLSDAAALGGVLYLLESMVGTNFLSPHFLLFLLLMAVIE